MKTRLYSIEQSKWFENSNLEKSIQLQHDVLNLFAKMRKIYVFLSNVKHNFNGSLPNYT